MVTYECLKRNEEANDQVSKRITTLYLGSIGTLLVAFLGNTIPNLKKGGFPVDQVYVSLILFALGIQSFAFYKKVVLKFQETKTGVRLSYTLAVILLALFISAIFSGWFTLIAVGLFFLFLKSYQLYRYCLDRKIGVISTSYFRKISSVYILLVILGLISGIAIDSGYMKSLVPILDSTQQIQGLESILSNNPSGKEFSNLRKIFPTLKERVLLYEQIMNSVMLVLTYALVFLALLSVYKFWIVRKVVLTDLYDELEAYYARPISPSTTLNSPPSVGPALTGLLLIIRPFVSGLAAAIGLAIYMTNATPLNFWIASPVFITIFLTSSFGFALNDFFDYEKDLIGHPNRVLPRKMLPRRIIPIFCFLLAASSLCISGFINYYCLLINLITLSLLFFYSWINNRFGFIANIITALTCSFIFIFGLAASSYNRLVFLSSVAVFIFILGREIMLDQRDVESDKFVGKSSIPIRFGLKKTLFIVSLMFLAATAISTYLGITFAKTNYLVFVSLGFNVLIWYSFLRCAFSFTDRSLNRFLVYSRIGLFLVIVGLL